MEATVVAGKRTNSRQKTTEQSRVPPLEMNGSQILIQALVDEGVKIVFGYPGGVVLGLYDEIFKSSKGFKHVLIRHEQGGTHAADGYARATGEPGVVLATSGPGATNTVTGITTAYMDSIPLVIFTGQVATPLIGNDAFQEAISALTALGYKANEAKRSITQIYQPDLSSEKLIRLALQQMATV